MKKIIGIYKITNKLNNKAYIGQSYDIHRRWKTYSEKSCHNTHLLNSFKLYGISGFSFEILEELSEEKVTDSALTFLEKSYIKLYETLNPSKGYNLKDAGPKGRPTEETKVKISEGGLRSYKEGRKPPRSMLGRKHSEETKAKISISNKGKNRGKPCSEASKKATSLKMKGVPKSEEQKAKMRVTRALQKPHSLESIERQAEKLRGRKDSEETRKKKSESAKKRTPLTKEQKLKRSIALKRYWAHKKTKKEY